MCFIFLALIVVIAVTWECVRKCRTSLRGHHRAHASGQWRTLEDGSSVLVSSDGQPIRRLGPMASLLVREDSRSDVTNVAGVGAYQRTRTGGTAGMRADAHGMSGNFAPYDPPTSMTAFRYPPPSGVPTAPAATPPESRNSIKTHGTDWSGETKIAGTHDEAKNAAAPVRS